MHDLWRDIALASDEQARDTSFQHSQNKLVVQSQIKIASLPLKQYKPEDISLDVDGENIIDQREKTDFRIMSLKRLSSCLKELIRQQ